MTVLDGKDRFEGQRLLGEVKEMNRELDEYSPEELARLQAGMDACADELFAGIDAAFKEIDAREKAQAMKKDDQLAIAKDVFNEPGQKVVGVDNSHTPNLDVTFEDEYGKQVCTVTLGELIDEYELRRSLEAFKRGRAAKIGEWDHQKKLSAEIVAHLNGEPDPTGRMGWLPKHIYGRFLDDFRIRFSELEKLVNDPTTANKDALIAELESIPFSWQKSP